MARRTSHLTHLGPNSVGGERERKKRERRKEKKKKRGEGESREKSSTFSLNFPTIESSVSDKARGKVLHRDKSCKKRPKTRSFNKLQEVEVFLLLSLILS